jgi:4-hydroxy-tetrahydrodipicolinate reductase
VNGADDTELVAKADPRLAGAGDGCYGTVAEAIAAASPEVAVDFTQPDVAYDTVRTCLEAGVHAVVGTTGLTDEQMAEVELILDKVEDDDDVQVVFTNLA